MAKDDIDKYVPTMLTGVKKANLTAASVEVLDYAGAAGYAKVDTDPVNRPEDYFFKSVRRAVAGVLQREETKQAQDDEKAALKTLIAASPAMSKYDVGIDEMGRLIVAKTADLPKLEEVG